MGLRRELIRELQPPRSQHCLSSLAKVRSRSACLMFEQMLALTLLNHHRILFHLICLRAKSVLDRGTRSSSKNVLVSSLRCFHFHFPLSHLPQTRFPHSTFLCYVVQFLLHGCRVLAIKVPHSSAKCLQVQARWLPCITQSPLIMSLPQVKTMTRQQTVDGIQIQRHADEYKRAAHLLEFQVFQAK